MAVQPSTEQDPAAEALAGAWAAKASGNHRLGAELAQQAAEQARQAGDGRRRVAALGLLALHQFRIGEPEAAIGTAQQALPLLASDADAAARTDLLCTMTMAYNDLGLHAEALEQVMSAIEAARICGVPAQMSWALNRAGLTYEALGQMDEAERFLLRALEIARRIDGDEEKFSALNNLCSTTVVQARAAADRGELLALHAAIDRSISFGTEALALAQASKNAHREAISHANLCTSRTWLSDFDAALQHHAISERIAHEHGFRGLLLTGKSDLAQLLRTQGRLDEAIDWYRQALTQADAVDDRSFMRQLHLALYQLLKQRGDLAGALAHHEALFALESELMQQRAETRTRLLANKLDLELAHSEAERARLDAELQRLRARQLEGELQQLALQTRELNRRVLEDELTGLANRRHVDEELPRRLALAREHAAPQCIAVLDLDHFKRINDEHGHSIGDDVLRRVARLLGDNTRGVDLAARIGGEEFLILFGGSSLDAAAEACERLRQAVASHDWTALAAGMGVSISIGLCDAGAASDARSAIQVADAALYAAKHAGRNRVHVAR